METESNDRIQLRDASLKKQIDDFVKEHKGITVSDVVRVAIEEKLARLKKKTHWTKRVVIEHTPSAGEKFDVFKPEAERKPTKGSSDSASGISLH